MITLSNSVNRLFDGSVRIAAGVERKIVRPSLGYVIKGGVVLGILLINSHGADVTTIPTKTLTEYQTSVAPVPTTPLASEIEATITMLQRELERRSDSPLTAISGQKTEPYSLVIVDFAETIFPDSTIIGHIIDQTIKNRMPIVTTEWDGYPMTPEPYRSKLRNYWYHTVVKKSEEDAFSNTNLEDVLKSLGNGKLVIIGSIGELCLTKTARSAIDRGYEVFASDETSIEGTDGIHDVPMPIPHELVRKPINSHKGQILWNRSSGEDYRRITSLIGGDFTLRGRVYRRTVEEGLKFAQSGSLTALSSAKTYAWKLGIELPP